MENTWRSQATELSTAVPVILRGVRGTKGGLTRMTVPGEWTINDMALFKVIFWCSHIVPYFPNGKPTIWGIYREYMLYVFWSPEANQRWYGMWYVASPKIGYGYVGTLKWINENQWYVIWYVAMIWYDMVWYGMIWYDMVWYGMIWYDMVWQAFGSPKVGWLVHKTDYKNLLYEMTNPSAVCWHLHCDTQGICWNAK